MRGGARDVQPAPAAGEAAVEDNLVVGSTSGYVSYSTDGASTWTNITSACETGAAQVTADADITYIYATTDKGAGDVKRWKIGQPPPWEDIYGPTTMGATEKAYGIALVDGVLYVVINDTTVDSYLLRNLGPTGPKTPTAMGWSKLSAELGTNIQTNGDIGIIDLEASSPE